MRPLQKLYKLLFFTAKRFVHDRCDIEARSLSYITLLTIVPFILVILQSLKYVPVYSSLKALLLRSIETFFLPDKTELIMSYMDQAMTQPGSLGILGLVLTFGTSFFLFFLLTRGVNRIWGNHKRVHLLYYLYKYALMVTIVPLLLLLSFYLQNANFIRQHIIAFFRPLSRITDSSKILGFLLNWFIMTLVFFIIPHGKVRLLYALISGITSGSLWYVTKLGINKYVAIIPQMNLIYGSITFLPIFLLWLYASWAILLFGLELNNALHFDGGKLPYSR